MLASDEQVTDLLRFLDRSPTPFHATEECVSRLRAAGFRELRETDAWKTRPGEKIYTVRSGTSVCALVLGDRPLPDAGVHLIGAHTDSPNLRVKPNPASVRAGHHMLGVEVYGGVLLHTWLDRDLGLAGQVVVRGSSGVEGRLVDIRRPLLRVPSLAIHLHREVNSEGLVLNAQTHLPPLVALEAGGELDLRKVLGEALDVSSSDILDWDLSCFDVVPAALGGNRSEYVFSARLDNLASCHAALSALLGASSGARTRGIVLFDHEEVGSQSAQGAAGSFLRDVLTRLSGGGDELLRAIARSCFVSADMAHAVHPNYEAKHEPNHRPLIGKGPVIKSNSNQRYATDALGAAMFEECCREAGVVAQRFVTRSDLGCGSTIGPMTAASLGLRTIDVGNPMLSMHSCREMAGANDVPLMIRALRAFLEMP